LEQSWGLFIFIILQKNVKSCLIFLSKIKVLFAGKILKGQKEKFVKLSKMTFLQH